MPNKTEEYLALAQRTANGLTRYLSLIHISRNWYLFELSDDDRKAIQQESVKILENIPQAGIGRRRIWEPVSYTHLDVYKRQDYG